MHLASYSTKHFVSAPIHAAFFCRNLGKVPALLVDLKLEEHRIGADATSVGPNLVIIAGKGFLCRPSEIALISVVPIFVGNCQYLADFQAPSRTFEKFQKEDRVDAFRAMPLSIRDN